MDAALLGLAAGLSSLVAVLFFRRNAVLTARLLQSDAALADRSAQLDAVLGPGTAHHFVWNTGTDRVQPLTGNANAIESAVGRELGALLAAMHPDDVTRVTMQLDRMRRGDADVLSEEVRFRFGPDGRLSTYVVSARARRRKGDQSAEVYGLALDVTALREVAAEASSSEHRFRELAEAMPQIVYVSRHDGVMEYANARWTEYTGIASAAPAELHHVVHPDDLPGLAATWQRALQDGTELSAEFRLRGAADGRYRWFLTRAVPARDSSGTIARWYGTSTDIEDVRAARQALETSDRRKDEFLATLAHELRNPLAPIRNAITILQLSRTQAELPWALGLIDRQLKQMTRLIDDLMDVSRINEGKLTLQVAVIDLRTVVHDAVETCCDMITLGNHAVRVEQPSHPVEVMGDGARLTQIVANLLNNAVKYSDSGSPVAVRIAVTETHARIAVADSGIGIPADQLQEVFGMFKQVPDSVLRSKGGLGIGLALVSRLVALHGGSVEADSPGIGGGSTFTMSLPLATVPPSVPMASPAVPDLTATSPRVLLVDDNTDAVESLAALLGMRGARAQFVHHGRDVIGAAESFDPDVIVLDIGLPDVNGYEVCRMIRSQPWGPRVPIIALTGWGQAHDRALAMEAGFDRHVTKPVHPDELLRVIDDVVRASAPHQRAGPRDTDHGS